MSRKFSLHVVLTDASSEAAKKELNELVQSEESEACFAVHAESCRISQPQRQASLPSEETRFALLFVPATIVDSSLEQIHVPVDSPLPTVLDTSQQRRLSERLLSMVHPFLAHNYSVKAVLPIRGPQHATSDLVILDLSHTPSALIADLLDQTSCQMLHSGPPAILKILLIQSVAFSLPGDEAAIKKLAATDGHEHSVDIPSCPVCLHRIDPWRLGLSAPRNGQLCSKFCPPPNLALSGEPSCQRQILLQPWPQPSHCKSCRVIHRYWNRDADEGTDLLCYSCSMRETLWVCLTCAVIGCGRYSNKHAAQHYRESGHPFCLELSTLRIWDYTTGEFTHRLDLLECPSSPPLMHPWIPASSQERAAGYSSQSSAEFPFDDHHHQSHFDSIPHPLGDKSPKKATMIGEEYEALLQSALEEQAQHYEGEITRLRTELTAARVNEESLSEPERTEIGHLKSTIQQHRSEIESIGRELLSLQSQEAGFRAESQRLLREQQKAQEMLKQIQDEATKERNEGRMQVDELEQQISDLQANQKMRHQFSQDQELANAQIFGTTENETSSKKKGGKKSRRFFRK